LLSFLILAPQPPRLILVKMASLGYRVKISNVVFLHGITGQKTDIDNEKFQVDMTTTPYTTFIDGVDEVSNRIVLLAAPEGISWTVHP
jgi:hypothetical protein